MSRKENKKWIIGGSVIGTALVIISFLSLGKNAVYFYTPDEAIAQSQDLQMNEIKVGGMVLPGSQKWVASTLDLQFTLTDFKGSEIHIRHKGTPPDMFKEGSGVIVEGRIAANGKEMASRSLMVKHSEEYKKPEEGISVDKKLIEASMFRK